ncbi:hypothetical protein BO221_16005 [Archangium sp. Cb G35]|uniref:CHAT domain-containing protein n=1 Tax=Archangium sp. Cb G35 TaxID=1920190 RepID=UPI0009375620|nr:CHAT domain-containing protein [Archangium sp. Cb G35]OJT23513.1 hypothetical protein BO221_16005 [Archangium sp. Cb G35]
MAFDKWLEIVLERNEDGMRALAVGGRGEQPTPVLLGPGFSPESLKQFSQAVRIAASKGQQLDDAWRERAQVLHHDLFREDIQTVWARLQEAADGGPVLLRLMLHAGELQSVPWEALRESGSATGFLGSSADVLLARGVRSNEPWSPRLVSGAVRVLPVSPTDTQALLVLKGALAEGIAAGEIEWLEPLTGPHASWDFLSNRLGQEPFPHVIHFIGHGCVDQGTPRLCLVDLDGEPSWIDVELLGQQIQERLRKFLRLIVLDACEGANPGALACAAELLARDGADAVVAHLWPVRADVARKSSAAFYRSLTGKAVQRGDVARALNHARRAVLSGFDCSAEAFSPVLYLRGHDPVLFEFQGRMLSPPRPVSSNEGVGQPPPVLRQLMKGPFTLLLGDQWRDERLLLEGFHERLCEELAKDDSAELSNLPLSALSERYELRFGESNLNDELERVFESAGTASPFIANLARRLEPGVHITLLRLPVLELALAEQRPELTLYAIQPPERGERGPSTMMRREAGASGWERLLKPPRVSELEQGLVVLRLYRGYLPTKRFKRPLITEDDYLLGIQALKDLPPIELYDFIAGNLHTRPVLLLGMSMLSWHHRMLLYRLFEMRPLPRGSMALLEPEAGKKERTLWEDGQCLPGKVGVQVIEASVSEQAVPLDMFAEGGAP